jgi:hypothetical protein
MFSLGCASQLTMQVVLHGPYRRGFRRLSDSQWHSAYVIHRSTGCLLTLLDVSAKGIAGRVVFIDWYRWANKHGIEVDAMTTYQVPFSQILEALRDQGQDESIFRPGDILMIRFGYIHQYDTMDEEKRRRLNELYKTSKPDNIGIKPSEDLLRFLWNNKIAAVCGDSRSFEAWPCQELDWHLHEWLLAGFGMPIGELFDLEELSQLCSQLHRYTFFLSSSPMNVSSYVAFRCPWLTF